MTEQAKKERRAPRSAEEIVEQKQREIDATKKRAAMKALTGQPGGRELWNARRELREAIEALYCDGRINDTTKPKLDAAVLSIEEAIRGCGGRALLDAQEAKP